MNKQFQKVIDGLEHHSGVAEWGCWRDNGDTIPNAYCSYFEENECVAQLTKDALELLKEYDVALRMMVYQYCTIAQKFFRGENCEKPDEEVFFHAYMCAGENAFKVLGIENGEEVTDEFIWS